MRSRPAETTGAVGSLALLLAVVFGADDTETIAAIGIVAGLVPAAVTLLVVNGGIRGVFRLVWRGRSNEAGQSLVEAVLVIFLAVLAVYVLLRIA